MREIKFRVFLPKIGKFISEEAVVENLMNPFNGKLVFNIDEIEYSGDEIQYYADDGYILSQYTGLKDKNGVEIYEGDIVRFTGGIGFVDYRKSYFRIFIPLVWSTNLCNETCKGLEHRNFVEVIGNLYENPELLK